MRELTGLDASVARYVLENPLARQFVDRYSDLLSFLLPAYTAEGKRYLTIGIGCTGGQHRSVAMVQEIQRRLAAAGHAVRVRHRDLPGVWTAGQEGGHG